MKRGILAAILSVILIGSGIASANHPAKERAVPPQEIQNCQEIANTITYNEALKEGWTYEECLAAFQ